jgi:hypothetical protein
MFLVKYHCRIKIGVEYIVDDMCVIKSGPIIVWMIVDCVSQYWKVDCWWLILGLLLFDCKG